MPKVQVHSCSVCGKDYLRLFRPYGEFLRVERIRCKQHVPEAEILIAEPRSHNE